MYLTFPDKTVLYFNTNLGATYKQYDAAELQTPDIKHRAYCNISAEFVLNGTRLSFHLVLTPWHIRDK